MSGFLLGLKYPLLLSAALSVDMFAAAFAYGNDRIHIPALSAVLINGICSALLAVALMLGALIFPVLPESITRGAGFLILALLGVAKLFDSLLKSLIRKNHGLRRRISFSAFSLCFILDVYADPKEADRDLSKSISYSEAASLALALSADGLAAGFGAGLSGAQPLFAAIFSFGLGMIVTRAGGRLGTRLACKSSHDFSWVSGALLLLLAFLKL